MEKREDNHDDSSVPDMEQQPVLAEDPYNKQEPSDYFPEEQVVDLPEYELNADMIKLDVAQPQPQNHHFMPPNGRPYPLQYAQPYPAQYAQPYNQHYTNQAFSVQYGQYPHTNSTAVIVEGVPLGPVVLSGVPQQRSSEAVERRELERFFLRRGQYFVCLNFCYYIVLLISVGSFITNTRNFKEYCVSYSRINGGYTFLNIVWAILVIITIYSVHKKSIQLFNWYIGSLLVVELTRIIVLATLIVLKKDTSGCVYKYEKDSQDRSFTTMIINISITVLVMLLFVAAASRLKAMLTDIVKLQAIENRNANANTNTNADAQPRIRSPAASR